MHLFRKANLLVAATESSGASMNLLAIKSRLFDRAFQSQLADESTEVNHVRKRTIAISFAMLALLFTAVNAMAQVNGLGRTPYLGWSTYGEQTIVPSSSVMNEQNILAQSDAMRSSGLEAHGFRYINLDAGWSGD